MNPKDSAISVKRLSHDSGFYNNVFKKAEKISSVILYVLSFKDVSKEKNLLEKSLEERSLRLHEVSLKSLNEVQGSSVVLQELRQCLLELMSTLEVAAAARLVTQEISLTVIEHIDGVHRHLSNHYLVDEGVKTGSLDNFTFENKDLPIYKAITTKAAGQTEPRSKRQQRVKVPAGDISSDAYLVYSQLTDRAGRVKTVLEAKPQATVKDVAEIITDVSEKTIQRELNSLIEKGQVKREGERRWSRYSVIKD